MSAIDELRKLLDERGVKWDGKTYKEATFWNDDINMAVASEGIDGKLWVSQNLTPAQAVEATLGRGECHNVGYYLDQTRFYCSACDYNGWVKHAADGVDRIPAYCPNCGRKVVE